MYNVHVKRFNKSMFTGQITHEEMEEEHGGELNRILSGDVEEELPQEVINRRNKFFIPYAFITASILVVGLILFVTFEDTAITTIDPIPVNVDIAALTVSADAGVAETGQLVWAEQDCATCHGDNAEGTPGTLNIGIVHTTLTFEEFVLKVRLGPADMKAYSARVLPDEDLAHVYAWLQSLED
jgi:cytochrome c553